METAAEHTPHIAVVTLGVMLGDETKGYTRFRTIAEMLVDAGFSVDLITTTFQHWEKAQRDTYKSCYHDLPYHVVFVYEPGYTKNLDLRRIASHKEVSRNLKKYFEKQFTANPHAYDLIYSEIPPNDMARVCAETADEHHIPYVADINDLWPEAMRMVMDVPVVSDVAYAPFERDARRVYQLCTAAVGTSDEYTARPARDRTAPYLRETVYVGTDVSEFDREAADCAHLVDKPENEFWAIYAGTLGASYDIETLVRAASAIQDIQDIKSAKGTAPNQMKSIRVKILGDGPDREKLVQLAYDLAAPVDFLGYQPHDVMAAYLCASDVTVNSLVKTAAQSIVTKIGDYLASGKPLINTGSSLEFRTKVETDGFGVNVEAENVADLAGAILALAHSPAECAHMGKRARAIAVEQFDRAHSYQAIVNLVRKLT